MASSAKIRCFVSLPLPISIRQEIMRIQNSFKKEKLFIGKYTHSQNLHLTLKFLGEINHNQLLEVQSHLRSIRFAPPEIQIGDPGVFSRKHLRIIWMHLLGANEIQQKVDTALEGAFQKEKRFMSHVTLARVKAVRNKPALFTFLDRVEYNAIKEPVSSIQLMRSTLSSQGPTYQILEEYSLTDKNR
jgi:2'-5' RNA ligase